MDGYAKCLFGSGDDAGKYTVKASLVYGKDEKGLAAVEVFSIDDAECWFPNTHKSIAASCAEYDYSFEDVDGNEFRFVGLDASGLKSYAHAMENKRGRIRTEAQEAYIALRKGGKNREQAIEAVKKALAARADIFRKDLLSFTSFGGSARSGRKKLDPKVLDSFKSLDEMKAYLRENGWVRE